MEIMLALEMCKMILWLLSEAPDAYNVAEYTVLLSWARTEVHAPSWHFKCVNEMLTWEYPESSQNLVSGADGRSGLKIMDL